MIKLLAVATAIAILCFSTSIQSVAEAAAGVYADASNPSGAPDPNKLDLIWQVDDLSGALSVKIPFPTSPTGGRGPKIPPFSLLYNSSSTVTLQTTNAYYISGFSGLVGTTDSNDTFENTNGNTASLASDSEGRTPFTTTWPVGVAGTVPTGTYTATTYGASGEGETYSVVVAKVPIGTYTMPAPVAAADFDCTGQSTSCVSQQPVAGALVSFVTSITLPNGTSYTFTPDPSYGTISKISFPSGGYVRFVYGVRSNGGGYGEFWNLSTVTVTDAYIPSGNFPAYVSGSSTGFTSTVTAPDGTYTQYAGFGWLPSALSDFWNGRNPTLLESQRLIKNASGTLIQSVATVYDGSLPTQITTTSYDGSVPLQQQVQIHYDGYSNVVEKDESDFYSCTGSPCPAAATPPSGWLRKTLTSYQYQNRGAWVTAHIVNRPSQILVTDGSGHPYSLVQYGYDETAATGPKGFMNHDDTYYAAGSALPRGNLTSEKRCSALSSSSVVTPANAATACSSWLTTTHTFDVTGQMLSTTDPKGYSINYGYADNYVDGTPSKPTNGYLTTATYANGAKDTYTYYPTTLYTVPVGGYGPVGPLNWTLGPNLSVTQGYTNRLWVNSFNATGQVP